MTTKHIEIDADGSAQLRTINERIWAGQISEAESLAKELLAGAAEHPEAAARAHSRLGEIFAVRGDFAGAATHYRSAIKRLRHRNGAASRARARRGLAETLLALGTPARAVNELARARADIACIDDSAARLCAEIEQLVLESLAYHDTGQSGRAAEMWRAARPLSVRLMRLSLSSHEGEEAYEPPRVGHEAVAVGRYLQVGARLYLDHPETREQGLTVLQRAVDHFRSFRLAYHHAQALEALGYAVASECLREGIDKVSAAAATYAKIGATYCAERAERWLASEGERLRHIDADLVNAQETEDDPCGQVLEALEGSKARNARALAATIATSSVTVLITGESGIEKDVFAEIIHAASRRSGKFVTVTVAAHPDPLHLEAELFGHVAGAMSGAKSSAKGALREAAGGTIFLDEVETIPQHIQAKLARALRERKVRPIGGSSDVAINVRVIAATHIKLSEAAQGDRLRPELFHLLNRVTFDLPPLRTRPHEIPLLADYLAARKAAQHDRLFLYVECAAHDMLAAHSWPGNVQELEAVIEHLVVTSSDGVLTAESVRRILAQRAKMVARAESQPPATEPTRESFFETLLRGLPEEPIPQGLTVAAARDAMQELLIRRALIQTKGRTSLAAALIDVHPSTITRWAKKRKIK